MNLETIYIVRHGIAEDRAASGRDADRRLTEEGIDETRRAAIGMRTIGVAPDLILTSPLPRADETARIIASVLAGKSDEIAIDVTDTLSPGVHIEQLLLECRKPPKPAKVMVVGHQPDLGMLASWLISGSAEAAFLPFRKASLACVETSGSTGRIRGVLRYFLSPAHLRAIQPGARSGS